MTSPLIATMTRLGMLRVMLLMTAASALLSLGMTWLLTLVMPVSDMRTTLTIATIVPSVLTPGFSYFTALSLRESRRARKAAWDMARADPLTGVANRRAFFELDREAQAGRAGGARNRALLFLDIDHFKAINDTHGHEAGDAVLRHLADLLGGVTRKGDILARFGGEEFVILSQDCDAGDAEALARRILAVVRRTPCATGAGAICYTVSIGIAVGASDTPIARLLTEADTQLYVAKGSGRDTARLSPMAKPACPPVASASASVAVAAVVRAA